MSPTATLALAAAFWFGIHPLIAGSRLRQVLVARLGEKRYRACFALLSLAALVLLVRAYGRAPCDPLWTTPRVLYFLPLAAMPLAFVLFAGAFTVPNPTVVGGEAALARPEPARGVLRVTRHPFLWAVMLWSGVHLSVNGNVPALLLFGSLFLTAALGTRDIDSKRARSAGEAWARYAAVTSNLPFAAVVRGKNRLVARELALPLVLGLGLSLLVLHFHASWFGLSALRALR